MDEEPPEQTSQSLGNPKTLVFSFESNEKQINFISELLSFDSSATHFSLCIERKNCCKLTILSSDQKEIKESENRIKEIFYNINHHEKNKWWFW